MVQISLPEKDKLTNNTIIFVSSQQYTEEQIIEDVEKYGLKHYVTRELESKYNLKSLKNGFFCR